ncbi:hypothetical protein FACS189430_05320 [Bacteroidia bacterium]|nr:hypothetical protein FACS189430_05320 [Bacteroidia bacterium]
MLKPMFKKSFLSLFLLLAVCLGRVWASGIQVIGTDVTTNVDEKSAQVKFSLTWDNSWRLSEGPKNWDAAWVFVKYRTLPGDNWNHAYLGAASTHKVPANALLSLGNSVAVVGGADATVCVGAFVYRKDAGNGTIQFDDVELNWNFAQNGLTGGEQVEVCVMATEMVYIPGGVTFYLGDLTSTGRFRNNPSNPGTANTARAETVFTVNNATVNGYFSNFGKWTNQGSSTYQNPVNTLAPTFSSVAAPAPDDYNPSGRGSVSNNNANDYATASAIHADYPRGFNAFYCMKYEITQGEYLQFLNKNLVAVKNAGYYYPGVMTTGRFDIIKKDGTGTATVPAEYDFAAGKMASAYLPCGYLGTKDIVAWLIWAGLRPMTELEFEKNCRGPETIPGTVSLRPQYAWGSINLYNAAGFSNKGMANEATSNLDGNCAVATTAGTATPATPGSGTNANLDGPMRGGGFANPVSSREKSGATYYGVMEMSGNLWERCVSIGLDAGRTFRGSVVSGHGNGETGPAATPDLPIGGGWSPVTGAGLGFRGGSYCDEAARARISDRYLINYNASNLRNKAWGGRGVRTAL